MKKFIAMLLMGVVLFAGAVGCGGDEKGTGAKEKETKKEKEKDKA